MTSPAPTPVPVRVIGLQRSGTNYLHALVERHFANVRFITHKVHWKHAMAEDADAEALRDALLILLHKNPYSWIESLTRTAKDLWKFHDLEGPGPHVVIRRGHYEGKQIEASVERLCAVYNRFHLGWLHGPLRAHPVRFEDVVSDAGSVIDGLASAGLARDAGAALDVDIQVRHSREVTADDRARLADLSSFDLSPEVIDAVSSSIDDELWSAFRYERLSTPRPAQGQPIDQSIR